MVYICTSCGKEIKALEGFTRCTYCGGRILVKKRPGIAREVSTD